jgi:uncharacterized membrane protein SirB2
VFTVRQRWAMKKSTKAEEDIMKFIGSKKITLALVSGLILFLSACGVSATPDETLTAKVTLFVVV